MCFFVQIYSHVCRMSRRQLSHVGLNSWSSPIINRNWQRGLETSTGFLIFMFNSTQAVKGSSVYSSCNVEWNYVNVLLWKNRRQSSWVITDNHDRMLSSTSSPLETPTVRGNLSSVTQSAEDISLTKGSCNLVTIVRLKIYSFCILYLSWHSPTPHFLVWIKPGAHWSMN